MTQILTTVRGKVKTGHANLSFFLALFGGACAAFSPIGAPVRGLAGILWWFTPLLVFTILFVICVGDWASDSVPNRPAVITAILWPSVLARVFTGSCGAHIFQAIRWLGDRTGGWGRTWPAEIHDFMTVSAGAKTAYTAFGVTLIAAAVVYAQRYAKSSKRAGAAGGRP